MAFLGTAFLALLILQAIPLAKTRFLLILMLLAAAAAMVGWLNLIVAWLTYRLEAGKVPRPDVEPFVDGSLTKNWLVELNREDPSLDVERAVAAERERLLAPRKPPLSGSGGLLGGMMLAPSEADWDAYEKKVEKFLDEEYRPYLSLVSELQDFWGHSRLVVLAFTNSNAGVPADGVKVRLTFPDDGTARLIDPDEIPDEPSAPVPPEPPKARSLFEPSILSPGWARADLISGQVGSLPAIRAPGNVSGPTIMKGSFLLEYEVGEILHDLHEDSRDHPVVLTFLKPGRLTVPYSIHARNLPQFRTGNLIIEARWGGPSELSIADNNS